MSEVDSILPLLAILASALAIPVILALRNHRNLREGATFLAAFAKFAIVASFVPGVLAGTRYVTDLGVFATGIELSLRVDALGLLFALLASTLWIVASCYSVGYMRGLAEHAQTRYFAAFAASLAATIGVAFSANLLTLFLFYELLTVATYPLVTHDETPEARAAGRKYLAYTFGGGVAVLGGTALVFWLTGTTAFAPGGIEGLASSNPTLARAAFVLLAGGFGVKAALMPMHSWLPDAMVAPTPVSGLLHAVAVVKSGVFGIARLVLDVYGTDGVAELGMGLPLAAIAAFTLVTASVIALRQDNLKRRLAYSTVSQLSYIVLGLALLDEYALIGGLLHIPAHGFMKLTLFLCAGAIHVETHTDNISEMAGIGKRMPVTMAAFAVAAAGMAGIPLLAGFVSKWYLVIGAVNVGGTIFVGALLLSGILNIAYFWPIVYQAFFESPDQHDEKPLIEAPMGGRGGVRMPRRVRADGGDHEADGPAREDTHHDDDGHGHHDDHGHGGGPGAGGWDRRDWFGSEASWFVLAPLLFTAVGSIVIGVAPSAAVFLQIIDEIVETLPLVVSLL